MSIVSGIEVFYISLREQGYTVASERLQLLKNLPVSQEPIQEDLLTVIGELKANHQLSFADCCIAGLAKQKAAILLHKDPEFEQLEQDLRTTPLSPPASGGKRLCALLRTSPRSRGD